MFSLNEEDFSKWILGCGDGPSSFNVECHNRGVKVTSVDPIYTFSRSELERRFKEVREEILKQTRANLHQFIWNHFASIEDLDRARVGSMELFLDDFESGLRDARYITGSLPELPFEDGAFDLCLVSHFLFLYSEQLDLAFHRQSIEEMMRVSKELRIFPLQQLGATPSPHLDAVVKMLEARYRMTIVDVDYEFQRGSNKMLVIKV